MGKKGGWNSADGIRAKTILRTSDGLMDKMLHVEVVILITGLRDIT